MQQHERSNFGYTLDELRTLVEAGIESGHGKSMSLDEIKAEARRRLAARRRVTKDGADGSPFSP